MTENVFKVIEWIEKQYVFASQTCISWRVLRAGRWKNNILGGLHEEGVTRWFGRNVLTFFDTFEFFQILLDLIILSCAR